MSKWNKVSKRMSVTGHGDMRNVRAMCLCACGTQVLINIIPDADYPQLEINVREHGAKRWRGAMISGEDALILAEIISDRLGKKVDA